MTDLQMQQCRQDFEQRFSGMDLRRWGGTAKPSGAYVAPATSTAWVAWEAAHLLLLNKGTVKAAA